MEKNYADWLSKTLEKENQSWQSGNPPEEDDQTGYFHTSEPIIIFQMVDQNLTVSLFYIFICYIFVIIFYFPLSTSTILAKFWYCLSP